MEKKKFKFVSTLKFGDIMLQMAVWIFLTLITCGIALPFFIYYFVRIFINSTEIHEV